MGGVGVGMGHSRLGDPPGSGTVDHMQAGRTATQQALLKLVGLAMAASLLWRLEPVSAWPGVARAGLVAVGAVRLGPSRASAVGAV